MSDNKAVLQSLFNTSLNHIRKQGKPSKNSGRCVYKAEDGCACAAAPFIIEYDPKMDEMAMGWIRVCEKFPNNVVKDASDNIFFVSDLQSCHDNVIETDDFMYEYESNMKRLAKHYGLDYTVA
jgi:hypothetical protein